MDKKPIILALLLVLVIVTAYAGVTAVTQEASKPTANGEVMLEVKGAAQTSGASGQVTLNVVKT